MVFSCRKRLIAEKWNFVHRRGPGRPGIMQKISALNRAHGPGQSGLGIHLDQFRRLIRDNYQTRVICLPPMSPNLNAYAERFVRSIKFECMNRMISIGEASLRRAVAEYMTH